MNFFFKVFFLLGAFLTAYCEPGIPKLSDVLFCSRWPRPEKSTDLYDSFESFAAFHGTRFEWVYFIRPTTTDPGFLAEATAKNIPVQGSISCLAYFPTNQKFDQPNNFGIKLDVNQKPMAQGIVSSAYPYCPSSPIFRNIFSNLVNSTVTLNIDSVQIDDWKFWNFAYASNTQPNPNRCYCNYCLAKFRDYLKTKPIDQVQAQGVTNIDTFDFRMFVLSKGWNPAASNVLIQQWYNESALKTLKTFWDEGYAEIQTKAGRRMPVSVNTLFWQPFAGPFDFNVGEFTENLIKAGDIYYMIQTNLTQYKRPTVLTLVSKDVSLNRRMIAMTTASGGNLIMPWDINLNIPNTPRYYGLPEEYADLSGMIRAEASHLDGYQAYQVTGYQIQNTTLDPFEVKYSSTVTAYLRRKTDSATSDAIAVIHVVDASPNPQGCVLKIKEIPGIDSSKLQYTLTLPRPYDEQAHQIAEATQNFEPLVARVPLCKEINNGYITFYVPPVTPWGIISVTYQ